VTPDRDSLAVGDGASAFSLERATLATEVLLVAERSPWRRAVVDALESATGVIVTPVAGGTDAMARLDGRHRFDCVVADAAGLSTSPTEFVETLRAETAGLSVLLCVSEPSAELTERALESGADDVLDRERVRDCGRLLTSRIESAVTVRERDRSVETLCRALDRAGHAALVTDREGTILDVNSSMVEMSGCAADELVGETPAVLRSGEHDEEFYADLWDTILDGDVWRGEVVNEDGRGSTYVVDLTVVPITDEAGSVTGFLALSREVSEHKQRERTLAFFHQAVDQIGTGMAAYDDDGIIQYANRAYADILGTTPRKLHGMHVASLNPTFDRSRFDEYWESFDTGETRLAETVHRRLDDDGETFPVDTITTRMTVNDETYHIGTIRDITERKERERELRLFRKAVEHAGHAVLITDREGTIEYTNPAFEEITGYTAEGALGETPAILKSGEHDEAFYADLWETILDGEVWEGELVNEHRDDSHVHIEQTIAPLTDGDGDITHFVGINNDITEMKQYERELERQNARLERFGQTVAHDLRNPINVVRANLEEARSAEDTTAAHDRIADSVDHMETLIDELLMLAKQGQTVLDPSPVDLETVARSAWDHVRTGAMRLRVTAETRILVDEPRACELFENLFRNAREHAGADAHVTVGTCSDGFYVADDGPGIPPQDRNRVLDSGFTTSQDGTGFGLSIVKQIATAHDWELSITESEAGGARFEFHDVQRE
jgi:PAS domain S-box-containing protein